MCVCVGLTMEGGGGVQKLTEVDKGWGGGERAGKCTFDLRLCYPIPLILI